MNESTIGSDKFTTGFARQIRLLREQQNISQQALADASGLSRNTLSLIERGKSSPTLDTLHKLAQALQVDISAFFQDFSRHGVVYDKGDAASNGDGAGDVSDTGTYAIDGLVSALILRLEPRARCGSLLPRGGQEFVYCLSGKCLFSVDDQVYVLEPGDSLRFDGRQPHYCQNPGQETAKALVIFLDFAEALASAF